MEIKGIKNELWDILFAHSLQPTPRQWFYSLDRKKVSTWKDIVVEFFTQYGNNVKMRVSIRTLEVLMQEEEEEGLFDYLSRWRKISTQLTNRSKLKPSSNLPKSVLGLRTTAELVLKPLAVVIKAHHLQAPKLRVKHKKLRVSSMLKSFNPKVKREGKRSFTLLPSSMTYTNAFNML